MANKKLTITVVLFLDENADIEELKLDFNTENVDYSFKHDYIVGSYIPLLEPAPEYTMTKNYEAKLYSATGEEEAW